MRYTVHKHILVTFMFSKLTGLCHGALKMQKIQFLPSPCLMRKMSISKQYDYNVITVII